MRKIVNARSDFDPMTEAEVDGFLESKLNVQQLATVDETGDPNIQQPFSLRFYYDKGNKKALRHDREDD
jgi:hypothetical protein